MGKVHGSLARAGKVKGQTPKVSSVFCDFCLFFDVPGAAGAESAIRGPVVVLKGSRREVLDQQFFPGSAALVIR